MELKKYSEKTELMQLLGHQCFFEYGDGDELNKGLREISEYYLPDWIIKNNEFYMTLVHTFLYGAIMGIKHERKKRKEKVHRSTEALPLHTKQVRNDTISMLNHIDREDVLEYINIIVKDVFKEVQHE